MKKSIAMAALVAAILCFPLSLPTLLYAVHVAAGAPDGTARS